MNKDNSKNMDELRVKSDESNKTNFELVSKNDEKIDKKLESEEEIVETQWLKSKFRIWKNLIVICIAWMFLFTAFQSMANLQSSLNSDKGLGTASLSTIYITLILSCLILPPIMIGNIGIKWSIVISQVTYLLFIAANIYPKWYILIPAAVLLGIGAAPLWTSKCIYLTEVAGYYAKLTNETSEAVVNRFFGVFFAFFQLSQIWGNVISSTVLKPEIDSNGTNITFNLNCGAHDCPSEEGGAEIKKPRLSTVYTLCGIYIGLAVISILMISILLQQYKRNDENKSKSSLKTQFGLLVRTVKHLKKPNQLLIIPLTLWLGFSQAYIGADFTKSFVSCTKGVQFVGLTMICFGVTDAIGSYIFGQLVKYVGRIPCILLAGVANYAMLILMIFWRPNPDQIYVLFIIPVFWGLADAVWQTQINSIYGVLFAKTEDAAFSNFRLWESLGFAVAYAYSSHLCVSIKLYLNLGYLTLGLIGYIIIEILERNRQSVKPEEEEKVQF